MDHIFLPQMADKIQKSVLNGFKLGVTNGNQEIYQDPAMVEVFKSIIENCCEIEQDVDHETALIENFQCNSVEEFDKEFTKVLAESHKGRPTAKQSTRYTKFIKDLEDIQYANQQSQADTSQINQSVTVDGMTVQSFAVRTDPITKALIKNPYINSVCKHVYDYDSISEAIRMNRKIRCPYVGCSNKNPVTIAALVEDRDFKRKLLQEQQESQMEGIDSDED